MEKQLLDTQPQLDTEDAPASMPNTQGQYTEDVTREPSSAHPSESSGTRTRKVIVRQAIKDKGVFETGVEVVEHEIELEEDDDGRIQALRLYNDGKLTHRQMKEILMRQLKQEKIFGFSSYDDFSQDYFKKKLVAVEDLNRVQVLKEARQRYEMRWKSQGRTSKYTDNQRRKRHEIMMQRQQATKKDSIITSYGIDQNQFTNQFDVNNQQQQRMHVQAEMAESKLSAERADQPTAGQGSSFQATRSRVEGMNLDIMDATEGHQEDKQILLPETTVLSNDAMEVFEPTFDAGIQEKAELVTEPA